MKQFVIVLVTIGLALSKNSFLEAEVSPTVSQVGSGSTALIGMEIIDECLEGLMKIDDLIEETSEFFQSGNKDLDTIELLKGGFEAIASACSTSFSSPELMDCSNDIEGIVDKLQVIINSLNMNPDADFRGLDSDCLSRAKEVCILPVAEEICEHELDANLEDLAALLQLVYGQMDATNMEIYEAALVAARELKTLYYACDEACNQLFMKVKENILRFLLIVESCEKKCIKTGMYCSTIDGPELECLVGVMEKFGILDSKYCPNDGPTQPTKMEQLVVEGAQDNESELTEAAEPMVLLSQQ
jgi:predicted house-cleaning noncanonical NTP pyrophosphatase (MazG superfamily)